MQPTSPAPARPKKRFPLWLKITIGGFVALFVLGAVFGKTPDQPAPAPVAAPVPVPTSSSAAPTSAAPVGYTVSGVSDAATVEVTATGGAPRTVHVLGVTAPTTTGCYAPESEAWATGELTGKAVTLVTDTASGVALQLADGTDYATAALQGGYAKYAAATGTAALQAAETTAQTAGIGLWGAPCHGTIDAPTPAPTPTPAPAPHTEQPAPPPPPETTEAQQPDPGVYYKNCAAAKAAHVTPLHRGEPGYRSGLDRDGDGTACEK